MPDERKNGTKLFEGILDISMQNNFCKVGGTNILPILSENLCAMRAVIPSFREGSMEIRANGSGEKKSWFLYRPSANTSLPLMKRDKGKDFSIGCMMVQFLSSSQGKRVKAEIEPGKRVAIFPI